MTDRTTEKLYIVSVEIEMMVLAKSPDDARQICREQRAAEEELFNADGEYWVVEAGKRLAYGWEEDHLVYNALGQDITVADAMTTDQEHPPDDPNQMTFYGDEA